MRRDADFAGTSFGNKDALKKKSPHGQQARGGFATVRKVLLVAVAPCGPRLLNAGNAGLAGCCSGAVLGQAVGAKTGTLLEPTPGAAFAQGEFGIHAFDAAVKVVQHNAVNLVAVLNTRNIFVMRVVIGQAGGAMPVMRMAMGVAVRAVCKSGPCNQASGGRGGSNKFQHGSSNRFLFAYLAGSPAKTAEVSPLGAPHASTILHKTGFGNPQAGPQTLILVYNSGPNAISCLTYPQSAPHRDGWEINAPGERHLDDTLSFKPEGAVERGRGQGRLAGQKPYASLSGLR